MAPSTRTSATAGDAARGASLARSCCSMAATVSAQGWESSRRTDASATAAANGLPMYVGPCISAPDSARETCSATSVVHNVAASVR